MSSLEARLVRVADFFRLPHVSYDPEAEVAGEGAGTWYRLTAATWAMMAASLTATYVASGNLPITIELAVVLIAALPVSYRLHFRPVSRLVVNWLTFTAAFVLGALQLSALWPLRHGLLAAENLEAMSFLILCFMWITAFRAFALRTVRDLVETILPCGSIILLTLVIKPTPLALASMALVVLGALALLAGQHAIETRQEYRPLATVTHTHPRPRGGSFYSWPTLYALVLVAAVAVSYGAARSELSGAWADYLRYTLARQVIRFFQPHENYLLPESGVMLWRLSSWPNSDLPVFRARTKFPGNWRTGCYHTYRRQWWQAATGRASLAQQKGERWRLPLSGSGAAQAGGTRVEQEITAVKYLQSSLPSLYCPIEVEADVEKLRYNADRLLRTTGYVRPRHSYRVVSYVPPLLPLPRPGTEVPAEQLAADLQLPDDLPRRVRDLAVQVSSQARTPYEKVHEIEQYLLYNYKYTLQAPYSYPNDFFDYFLFVSKRGFCHHFAGSMVIMCRCLGIPARLATGFLRGDEDKVDADLYTVREKDAHVWPEVYFRGAGWIAFEPTPSLADDQGTFQKAFKQIAERGSQYTAWTWRALQRHWPSAALLAAGLLLLAGLWQGQSRTRYLRAYRGADPEARVVRTYLRMRRSLARHGARDDAGIAPREFVEQLPPALWFVRQEASTVTENYLQGRFSRGGAPAAAATAAEEALAALEAILKRPPAVTDERP